MRIEFAGRVVRIDTDRGTFYFAPDEIFEIVDWAKANTLSLFMKSRELVREEERREQSQQRMQHHE